MYIQVVEEFLEWLYGQRDEAAADAESGDEAASNAADTYEVVIQELERKYKASND